MARAPRPRRQKGLPDPGTEDIQGHGLPEEEDTAMALPDLSELPEPELLTLMEEHLYRLDPSSLTRLEQLARETRNAKHDEARKTARDQALEIFKHAGVSVEEAFPELARSTTKGGGTLPAIYRGPGGELWTGRGHTPKWLTALEDRGYKKDLYKILPDGTTQWDTEHRTQAA